MAESRGYMKLPAGWDRRHDDSTGKCYYINYFTKAMQLEDPRNCYKQLKSENHSSESIPLQEMYAASRESISPNSSYMINTGRRQTIQETSFIAQNESDALVTKINNMFPTVNENHIRLLLKKYYNREAVVISALQVEKHPVTMPGPYATPSSQRHLFHSESAFQVTPPSKRFDIISRKGSPFTGHPNIRGGLYRSPGLGEQIRNSPRPHSSPKMKLRYLKSIFPKADETLLLDILANEDNNVQKACEALIAMGYTKKEISFSKVSNNKVSRTSEHVKQNERSQPRVIPPVHPKVLTEEEKTKIKERLQNHFNTTEERIITMALESVNYSEDRALQILQIVLHEDKMIMKKNMELQEKEIKKCIQNKVEVTSQRNSGVKGSDGYRQISDVQNKFKSVVKQNSAKGHNPNLSRGPDDRLLLADYVTWNGANPAISLGRTEIVVGPNPKFLSQRTYTPFGHNNNLSKGPKIGLAKGSIYSKINYNITTNIKCN